jgi:hypothetical protein
MSFEVTRKGQVLGHYDSADAAKASVPEVRDWRLDQGRFGWNGWAREAPFSDPDHKITLV